MKSNVQLPIAERTMATKWRDFKFSQGLLYPLLYDLESKGLIKGEWQIYESGRSKKYYSLTTKERRVLEKRHFLATNHQGIYETAY